jgi:molybdopterin synthase sulfur carrier subunit
MVKILYFARLKETLGLSSEEIALLPSTRTLGELRATLALRGGDWANALAETSSVRAAVNQEMADAHRPLRDGDEVAFFPPVTGG